MGAVAYAFTEAWSSLWRGGRSTLLSVITIMAALLAYAFLLEPIGYPLATAAVFVTIARVLGSRSIVRDVLVGLVLGFGLYTAFTQYLGVSLPAGLTPIF